MIIKKTNLFVTVLFLYFFSNHLSAQEYKIEIIDRKTPVLRDYTKIDSIQVINNGKKPLYFTIEFLGDTEGIELFSNEMTSIKSNEKKNIYFRILADTTFKSDKHYQIRLRATQNMGSTMEFEKYKELTVKIPDTKKELFKPLPLKKIDLLLFIAANFDPNKNSKISGSSFEFVIPFNLTKDLRTRIGFYSHPNFTRDSVNMRRTDYYYLNTEPLMPDKSKIGFQAANVGIAYNVKSFGGYFDFIIPLQNSKLENGVHLSFYVHGEYARRAISPSLKYNVILNDTSLLYTSALHEKVDKKEIRINPSKMDGDRFYAPDQTINQFYVFTGPLIELTFTNLEAFFQPYGGVNFYKISVSGSNSFVKANKWGLGFKAQVKLFDAIAATLDVKDLEMSAPYINISLGVPISIAEVAKKFK